MTLLNELEGMHQDHQIALKELHRHRGAIENKDLYILHVRKQLAGTEQQLTTEKVYLLRWLISQIFQNTTEKLRIELKETNSKLRV